MVGVFVIHLNCSGLEMPCGKVKYSGFGKQGV